MAHELLPCPFCGGEAHTETYIVEAKAGCRTCRVAAIRGHSPYGEDGLTKAVTVWNTPADLIPAMIAAAVAKERERCAVVAGREGVYPELNVYAGGPDWYRHGKRIAAAIRAGGGA